MQQAQRRNADVLSPEGLMIFTGNANAKLAADVASHLQIPLGKATVGRFSDGEVMVELLENVRGKDVYVLQSTCAPTNDHLMEVMIMVDALKRASAGRITAALPYFGYARQDRRVRSMRVAISAKVVANMLQIAGVDRVLTMDLHADQIQGFFDIPTDNLYAAPVMAADILQRTGGENLMVVSPDVGGVVRARALARRLNNAPLSIVDKRRDKPGVSEVMNIIGDVKGWDCILIDDIIDSGGTLCNAAGALMDAGAKSVTAYLTHGVMSGSAVERVNGSALKELVITDTIQAQEAARAEGSKIRVLSIAPLIGEAIHRIAEESSVSSLFD